MVRKSHKYRKTRARRTMKRRRRVIGGSANLDILPKEYYYSYNSNPILKGGRRRRVRGGTNGMIMDVIANTQNTNTLLGSSSVVNTDISVQPASNPFPANNIPVI